MSLGLFNCRLIQPARDQLFFFAGCLAAPVPVRASSVQSPCDASCSAPTSGRVRNASCVFPSQEGFVLVFRGREAPVGCRRVHPTDSPTNSPEDPPILPIDSAIEPDKQTRGLVPEIETYIGSLTFDNKANLIPLQAADILAYEAMKNADNLVLQNGKSRRSFERLNRKRYGYHDHDEKSILELVRFFMSVRGTEEWRTWFEERER